MTPEPISGFAEFAVPPEQDWRQKLDHGIKASALGVPS